MKTRRCSRDGCSCGWRYHAGLFLEGVAVLAVTLVGGLAAAVAVWHLVRWLAS